MGAPEVEAFLTDLAVTGKVSSSTQTQALSALLFLYKEVLGMDVPWMGGMVRAKPPKRIPTVLSVNHDDLHACAEPGRQGRQKPARFDVVQHHSDEHESTHFPGPNPGDTIPNSWASASVELLFFYDYAG